MKYSFPAIFEKDLVDDKFINVTFPDLLGAVTFGEGEEDALAMAKDLLITMLDYEYIRTTTPKSLEETQKLFPNKKIILVEVEI